MAKYIDQSSGRLTQLAAVTTSAGAGDGDKLVATTAGGILDDTVLNAATTGANKILKLDGSGLVSDTALGASTTSVANAIVKLDTNGKLDSAMLPSGIGDDAETVASFENLSSGDFVHVFDNAGTANVRKADAASGFEAHGFVLSAVTAPATVKVYFAGTNTGVTGQVGGRAYLSDTVAGKTTSAAPTTSGSIVQVVGLAVSATKVNFEPGDPILLA